jgi:eukaryotic-like serine/threonine-protein kinase
MQVGVGVVVQGKYRIDRVLGAGGMGTVVAATHLGLRHPVAIKLLAAEVAHEPEVLARFLREAQAAARLTGEHVARVLDVGALDDGTPFLVMEYLDGLDLGALIARRGRLPAGQVVDYALQACAALAEAHAAGVVHRDIKPANLFVTERADGTPLVKVLDFGISKLIAAGDVGVTRTRAILGTPAYMSPEQMRSSRDVDGRADLWALGVVLFECLAGRRPFDADTFSGLCLQAAIEPTPRLGVALPSGLERIVDRCLEKAADARFASAAALAAALAPFAGDPRAAAVLVERCARIADRSAPPPRARARRQRVKMRALVGAPPVALAGAYVVSWRGHWPDDHAAPPASPEPAVTSSPHRALARGTDRPTLVDAPAAGVDAEPDPRSKR